MAMAKRQKTSEWDSSHLDKRIDQVLGHFRKDFEGALSLESLGPKFGCYGSFLPMYKIPAKSPPTLLPPKGTTYTPAPKQVSCNPPSVPAKAVEKIRQVEKEPQKPVRIGNNAAPYYRRDDREISVLPAKRRRDYERRDYERRDYRRRDDERSVRIRNAAPYCRRSYGRERVSATSDEKKISEVPTIRAKVPDEKRPLKIRFVFGSEKRAQKNVEATR